MGFCKRASAFLGKIHFPSLFLGSASTGKRRRPMRWATCVCSTSSSAVCFCRAVVNELWVEPVDDSLVRLSNFLFEQARAVATSLKEKSLQSIQCRPYLEWILAEEEHCRVRKAIQSGAEANTPGVVPRFFSGLPGWTHWSGLLPIYTPAASENPGWPSTSLAPSAAARDPNHLLSVVLQASEELDDFSTQASCLQVLICRSQDPRDLFDKLDHLQLGVMGDKLGALKTRLSKYLLAVTEESRQRLYKELVALDPRLLLWDSFAHPITEWCHRRILHALMLSLWGDSEEARKLDRQERRLSPLLPRSLLTDLGKGGGYKTSCPVVPPLVASRSAKAIPAFGGQSGWEPVMRRRTSIASSTYSASSDEVVVERTTIVKRYRDDRGDRGARAVRDIARAIFRETRDLQPRVDQTDRRATEEDFNAGEHLEARSKDTNGGGRTEEGPSRNHGVHGIRSQSETRVGRGDGHPVDVEAGNEAKQIARAGAVAAKRELDDQQEPLHGSE